MENGEEQQKEFFEFGDRPKKIFPSLGSIFQKNDFENRYLVTLSPERLVFTAIGIVMLLVLVYALGVERGRSIAAGAKTVRTGGDIRAVTAQKAALKPGPAAVTEAKPEAAAANVPEPAQPVQTAPAAFYTIVTCTFTKDGTAAAEANRLKTEGLDTHIYRSGSYYQICVGRFQDSGAAKDELARVRRYYKDAYIKLRQQ